MSGLRFFGADAAAGFAAPDLYFTAAYGRLVEASDGGTWELAASADGRIVQPFLLRPVPEPPDGRAAFDVVSPYGYAGPASVDGLADLSIDLDALRRFRADLRAALVERGVLAEFIRFSPLLANAEPTMNADATMAAVHANTTVAVNLRGGAAAAWDAAEGRSRTAVRKASSVGLRATVRPLLESDLAPLGAFRTLYEGTMRRVGAKPYYLFGEEYYRVMAGALLTRTALAEVNDTGGEVVAAALFFRHGPYAHYHLAGSRADAARLGANALLLHAAIRWACDDGATDLHLGGGLKDGDALFLFKRSFGGRTLPFVVGRSVLDPARYERFVEARAAATGRTPEALHSSGWFPAYRG